MFGGRGGGYFSYGCPRQRLTRIDLWTNHRFIRAIRTNYRSNTYGLPHGSFYRISLRLGENIIAAIIKTGEYHRGRAITTRVKQLAFLTKYRNHIRQYGPYGEYKGDGIVRIITKNIVSFYGRSGHDLDALGFYYRR